MCSDDKESGPEPEILHQSSEPIVAAMRSTSPANTIRPPRIFRSHASRCKAKPVRSSATKAPTSSLLLDSKFEPYALTAADNSFAVVMSDLSSDGEGGRHHRNWEGGDHQTLITMSPTRSVAINETHVVYAVENELFAQPLGSAAEPLTLATSDVGVWFSTRIHDQSVFAVTTSKGSDGQTWRLLTMPFVYFQIWKPESTETHVRWTASKGLVAGISRGSRAPIGWPQLISNRGT